MSHDHLDNPGTEPEPALVLKDLEAGVRLSLTLPVGEIHALVGPAGTGKSAAVEAVLSPRRPAAGTIRIFGRKSARERVGGMLQSPVHDPDRTVAATMRATAGLYRRPLEIGAALDAVGLSAAAETRVGDLPGSSRRLLDFALALVGNPTLMVLDEPFAGLEPEGRRRIRELIRALADHGRAILIATQDVNGMYGLVDRVTVLADGRVRASGTPQSLLDRLGDSAVIDFLLATPTLPDHFPQALRSVADVRAGRVRLTVRNPTPVLADLANWAFREQVQLTSLTVERPRFEEAYRALLEAPAAQ